MQVLEGVRILDLTGGVAGPLGVLQLAEHGADVLRIEPPSARASRADPSSMVLGRSRRSVTLDLEKPEGVALLRELCSTADVLAEAFAPGTMARLGLDYDSLREDFPRLVYCALPAYPTGSTHQDRPGYDALVTARAGQNWENPSHRDGPVFLHSPVASFATGLLVPVAIMSALVARDRTGVGQRVEVSLLQGVLSLTTQNWSWSSVGATGNPRAYPSIHQQTIYECRDGKWIHAPVMSGGKPSRSEGDILGIEDVAPMVAFALPPEERAAYEEVRRAAFLRRDRDELVDEYHAAGRNAEPIIAPHERFTHPQLLATGSVVEVVDPEAGPTTQIGPTLFLSATPGAVRGPRPLPGADTDEILGELGHDPVELADLRAKGVI
jgi:crotonobetainyl-CoA:carnitine CoA-transferase CaiB-like acyl-CoA transferase